MAEQARMRVLFMAHAYPRYKGDPVGSFIHNLATALQSRGVDVVVSAPSAPGVPAREVIDGVEIRRFRYAPGRYETLAYTGTMGAQVRGGIAGKLAMASYLLAAYRAASHIVREMGVDVVHAHWWFPAGLVAAAMRRTLGLPFVITMHGSDLRLVQGFPTGEKLYRSVASRAGTVTAVSSWLARGAEALAPAIKVLVTPMPVLTEMFHADDSRDSRRLLFVGKLSEQKGLSRLLRAMAMMKKPCTLTVVGAGRIDDSAVLALAASLGLSERIEWLPILSQHELALQYRRAAIHVIPALDEGLGLTAVEALLSETPVVGFDSGGLPDVVLDGITGSLIPPGDEAKLSNELDVLLESTERRASMGLAGRAHALRLFSRDAAAERFAGLYRDLVPKATSQTRDTSPGREET